MWNKKECACNKIGFLYVFLFFLEQHKFKKYIVHVVVLYDSTALHCCWQTLWLHRSHISSLGSVEPNNGNPRVVLTFSRPIPKLETILWKPWHVLLGGGEKLCVAIFDVFHLYLSPIKDKSYVFHVKLKTLFFVPCHAGVLTVI